MINNINIRTKLLLSFFFVVIIPVIIMGIIFINKIMEISIDYTVRDFLINVERVEKDVVGILEKAKALSDRFYVDERLKSIINKKYNSLLEVTRELNNFTDFDYYIQIDKDISAIRVYTTNTTILENWRFMKVTKETEEAKWFRDALEKGGRFCWTYFMADNRAILRLSRALPFIEGNITSILTIDIDIASFTSLFDNENFTSLFGISDDLFATLISFGPSDDQMKVDAKNIFLGQIYDSVQQGKVIKISKASYYRVVNRIDSAGFLSSFYILSLFPIERLNENKQEMLMLGFILILVCLVVSGFLIFILSHHVLSRRIRFLSAEMHKIAGGDFDINLELEGQDEIGQLSRDITAMIRSLKELITRVYESDLQKKQFEMKQKDMKFKLLASQINPHFFFNALETIRAKARTNRTDELGEIVKSLGKIMRRSLEIQNKPVTVGSEVEYMVHYLEIQKYRFEEKLTYDININPAIEELMIIPHILQPIVENAVIHGIEKKIGPGRVKVQSEESPSSLIFSVEDDGPGLENMKLTKIQQALKGSPKSGNKLGGIGLINVHERISLYYGKSFGLHIESEKGIKTRVEIILPRVESLKNA